MKRLRNSGGFSMAELMTTLGLASLIAVVALPTVSSIYARYQLAGTANRVAFEVTRARMQAVGQNRFVRFAINSDGFSRETSEDGINYVIDGGVTPLATGLTIIAGSTGLPSFNRAGLATTATTLTIKHGSGSQSVTKTVTVNTIGRVNLS